MGERTNEIEVTTGEVEELVVRAGRGEPVVLTRGAKPVAAVITIEALDALVGERELLRRLALGELESAAAEGDDLASVLNDCRLMLEEN